MTKEKLIGDKWKDTGRYKIIFLASAPMVPVNSGNCKIFMNKTNINEILYTFSGDLKIMNMMSGKNN